MSCVFQDGTPDGIALAASLCFAGEVAVANSGAAGEAARPFVLSTLRLLRSPAAESFHASLCSSMVAVLGHPECMGASLLRVFPRFRHIWEAHKGCGCGKGSCAGISVRVTHKSPASAGPLNPAVPLPAGIRAALLDLCVRSVCGGGAIAQLEEFWGGVGRPSPLALEAPLPFTVASAVAAYALLLASPPAAAAEDLRLLAAAASCLPRVLEAVPAIETPQARAATLRALLPALLSAADLSGSGEAATAAVRSCCAKLLGPSGTVPHRRTGLSLLVHFADRLSPLPQAYLTEPYRVPTRAAGSAAGLDASAAEAGEPLAGAALTVSVSADDLSLLVSVREALNDPEPMLRKQALHVLRHALGAEGCVRPPWREWFVLYDALDDYSMHLFTGAWTEARLGHLHPPAPGSAGVAAPEKERKKKGAERGGGASVGGGQGVGGGVCGAGAVERVGPPLEYEWVAILWRRGHCHANPQIRRAILAFLGSRDWRPPFGAHLPEGYAFGPLLMALQVS